MSPWYKKYLFLLTLNCCCLFSFAQLVTVRGKVIDAKTGTPVPGTTIIIGNSGTSTDSNGEFVLLADKAVVNKSQVKARAIGYLDAQLPGIITYNQFRLVADPKQLKAVTISGTSETIVQKAFRRIPINYVNKEFNVLGQANMLHTAKDTAGYQYFYKNRSAVKLSYQPYASDKTPQIAVVKKEDTLAQNSASTFRVHFVGGYTGIAQYDLVHSKTDFLKGDPKRYKYRLNNKEWLNGTRVFVINFSSNDNKQAGTLYIDTASYAFVKISYTRYHMKRTAFIDIDKRTATVQYNRSEAGWVISSLQINSLTNHGGFDISRTTEFLATSINADRSGLAYQFIIPSMMEDKDIAVSPFMTITPEDSLQLATAHRAADSTFSDLPMPMIKTTDRPNFLHRLSKTYREYLLKDNIRFAFGLARLPLQASGYQPILTNTVKKVNDYSFSYDIELRLWKNKEWFVEFSNRFNPGIGGLRTNEQSYNLIYNIIFNNTGHPVTLTPLIGRSEISFRDKGTNVLEQKNWIYGISLSYEISPRINVFAGTQYYQRTHIKNDGLLIHTSPLSLNTGLLFSIKY